MNKDYIYKRRLLKLADFLDKLPPDKFDFSKWVGNDWQGKPNLSCGTRACALGWGCTIPSFRKAGLVLKPNPDTYSDYKFIPGLKGNESGLDGTYRAGRVIFGLVRSEFKRLFTTDSEISHLNDNASSKQVAKEIRKFVKERYK